MDPTTQRILVLARPCPDCSALQVEIDRLRLEVSRLEDGRLTQRLLDRHGRRLRAAEEPDPTGVVEWDRALARVERELSGRVRGCPQCSGGWDSVDALDLAATRMARELLRGHRAQVEAMLDALRAQALQTVGSLLAHRYPGNTITPALLAGDVRELEGI